MTFIVATNVIASRPPERRPTGTPHACANLKTETPLGIQNFQIEIGKISGSPLWIAPKEHKHF